MDLEPPITLRCSSMFANSNSIEETEWEPFEKETTINARWDKDLNIKRLKTDMYALDGLAIKAHQPSFFTRQ